MHISPELRQTCIHTIRFLAVDAIEKAKSGHPGTPMGAADIAFVLWTKFLRYNPKDPQWIGRDRFVLSAGHASMLQYSMLHLSGYDVSLEDLKQFRQYGSQTPGHPEVGLTPGIECTTGPLGAGLSNSVGMALAAKMAQARFNTSEHPVLDPYVYVLCSDGDIEEGVTSEAGSLAGHLGLGNLIAVYDKNDITIAGDLNLSMSEDTGKRYESYGWHVQYCDGHDHDALEKCLINAQECTNRPSIIIAQTTIGKGSPNKQGSASSHGAPLGADEIRLAKEAANWPQESFHVPLEVREAFAERAAENQSVYDAWHERLEQWKSAFPDKAALWQQHWNYEAPENLLETLVEAINDQEHATRSLSGVAIQSLAKQFPSFVGGSGDLEPSTVTLIKDAESIRPCSQENPNHPDPSFAGKNIHFGIREHAMGSVVNGMLLFGGWRPFCATFAVFSDYMRPTLRLAAISELPTTFIFTHDSICVGEDGPTHQPIEQLWALRVIPNLEVWRPSDAKEVAAAWTAAMQSQSTPTAMFLTRQKLENLQRSESFELQDLLKGGYVVQDASKTPQLTLVSTGSEGNVTAKVRSQFEQRGIPTRHVSIPCLERFKAQGRDYIENILPPNSTIVAIELGTPDPWYQYADHVIGMESFGMSGPYQTLLEEFGFTADALTQKILGFLGR